jgi:hypothetical protein
LECGWLVYFFDEYEKNLSYINFFLLISQASAVEIRGIDFEIPNGYLDGQLKSYGYVFKNGDAFSILCIGLLMGRF